MTGGTLPLAQFLMQENAPFLSAVGFHCQQAAEKYVKAYLIWKQVDFPKTHNIASFAESGFAVQ